MINSNDILYPPGTSHPDHLVVIKYVPHVGDSKRAMDEYTSRIAMGGDNTMVIHNTCEDSLLAAPIMLDLVIFLELFQRMEFKVQGEVEITVPFAMAQVLGYWLKAPIATMTNSLFRQRACIENTIRAALSLPPTSHLFLNTNMQETSAANTNGHVNGVIKVVGSSEANSNGHHEVSTTTTAVVSNGNCCIW